MKTAYIVSEDEFEPERDLPPEDLDEDGEIIWDPGDPDYEWLAYGDGLDDPPGDVW